MKRAMLVGVVALLAVYVSLVELPVLLNWQRYCNNGFDLGIFAQAVREMGHGDFNPWIPIYSMRFFADHFDPIVVPVSVLAGLMDPSLYLMLVESGAVLGAFALLVRFAVKSGYSVSLTLCLGALFLFSCGVINAVTFPVHPSTWATVVFLGLAVATARDRAGWIVALALALLLFKEEHTFVVLALGLHYVRLKRFRLGASLLALGGAWYVLAFHLRPLITGPTSPYTESFLRPWQEDFGGTLSRTFTSSARWLVWLELFVPFGPLLFVAWRRGRLNGAMFAALVPILAIRLIADRWTHQYGAIVTATLAGLFVVPGEWTRDRVPRAAVALTAVLLLGAQLQFLGQYSFKTLFRGGLTHCPASTERIEELSLARREIARFPQLPLYASGNLLPRFMEHDALEQLGTTTHVPSGPFLVLTEGPPTGSAWPKTFDALQLEVDTLTKDQTRVALVEGRYIRLFRCTPR